MRAIFCALVFASSISSQAKVLDCTKLSLKSFKFSKNCVDGAFKKVSNGSQINPECVVSAQLGSKTRSIYFAKPERNTDFIGLTKECESHEGHTYKDLPKGCRIFFNFDSMSKLDYNSCVCSNMGCGQHLIQGLNQEEIKDLKVSIGTIKDEKHNLTKSCNGDLDVVESAEDKTALLVSSTECIFRSSSTGIESGQGYERFCIEGVPTDSELQNIKQKYLPRALRLSDPGRIFAVVCVPVKKSEPMDEHKPVRSVQKKDSPLAPYWPQYNQGRTNEASRVDK